MLAKIIDFPAKANESSTDAASLSTVLSFLNRVSNVPDTTNDFKVATKKIFEEVCAFTGWPIAHLYIKTPDTDDQYVSNDIWYLEDTLDRSAIAEFRRISEETVFTRGKGLIGQIAQEKEAKAVEDVTVLTQFLRADSAKRSGVRGFFGFPIIVSGDCVAIAEFYGRQIGLLDETSLEIMQYVSAQLARLYEREQNHAHQEQLVEQFLSSVQASVNDLATGSDQLDEAGQGVQSQAQINNQQCTKVAQGRTTISDNLHILQDAIERLVDVETQTLQSNTSVNQTVDQLGFKVSNALTELEKLGELAANIESIARNVSEISGQVRMLGLNASIEAARAGSAGKGFAIVAAEIKSLALQSEQSSQDISNQLGDILNITSSSIGLMNDVDASMTDLESNTTQMSDVVGIQHEATDTIRQSLNSVQTTFSAIDTDVETMNGVSSDLLGLADHVGEQVLSLKGLSQDISTASDSFIKSLSAQ
ncbi:methyl-accepting chemotaxis protein [Terasakiella sp. SH-1]|uniref:methyl-accepting chemotaxis protein n=1 Tax=Terasakiella sp. SH-1 TaxID=2560057 RepID=UPI00142FAF22|nr:methyl-accepting chemotaxis protein [Terasakiella sp. SH-1]